MNATLDKLYGNPVCPSVRPPMTLPIKTTKRIVIFLPSFVLVFTQLIVVTDFGWYHPCRRPQCRSLMHLCPR